MKKSARRATQDAPGGFALAAGLALLVGLPPDTDPAGLAVQAAAGLALVAAGLAHARRRRPMATINRRKT